MAFLSRLKKRYKDASDEVAWHVDQRTQELISQGMSPEQARDEARKRVGNVTALAEEAAESDSFAWLDTLKRDVVLALRMLRRAPTVSAVAILSLGLGIGANTVVFTLMKQIVLDYLPVPHPEQLVILHSMEPYSGHTYSNGMNSSFSYPLYKDLNASSGRAFTGILAFRSIDVSVTGREATESVHGGLVSGNFFQVLQVNPWRGRLFVPADDQKVGGSPVVVLGYGFWRERFAGDPNVVNQTILVNKHPYVVLGIAPPQFYGIDVSDRADLYVPMCMKADVMPDPRSLYDRMDHWTSLMARMKPGLSLKQAAAALSVIYPPLRDQELAFINSNSEAFKKEYAKKQVKPAEGGQGYASIRNDLSDPLKILMVMVAIVLLIAVVNIANLLVARGVARQREMAIRLSVGAGKGTIVRQLLMESLVLAGLGGLLGAGIAYAGTPALLHALSFDLSSASISARPDWHVLSVTALVTLAAGLFFGLLPAWQSARTDVGAALKSEGAHSQSGRTGWLRRVMVVAQVALSLVLLTSAILFTRSLANLKNINVGFNTANLLKFRVNPLQAGYSQVRIKSFGEELRQKIGAIPGVVSASLATIPLLEDNDAGGNITVEGGAVSPAEDVRCDGNQVAPKFFSTLQIPIVLGRDFNPSDDSATSKVALVNQTFVKRFLPKRNPIGVHFGFGGGHVKLDHTIVGVVADSEHSALRSPILPFIYEPYLESDHLSSLHVYVRVNNNEQAVAAGIRSVVRQMDSDLPVDQLSSMTEVIDESIFVEKSLGYLSIGFAVLATLLAVVGLYGVMAYSVTSRSRELGIRMAIGATPEGILTMVLRESAYLGIAGSACGVPFLLGAASYIRSSLYGVQPNDPIVWITAIALLVTVALLAGLVPAWQAARIDPHSALRSS